MSKYIEGESFRIVPVCAQNSTDYYERIEHYVIVTNLLGAYYYEWTSTASIAQLRTDRYTVMPTRLTAPRASLELASTVDIIADICFMLANSQYGIDMNSTGEQADLAIAAANGMRDALELLVESLGQNLLKPPTKASQSILDMFTKRMVQRMQTASIMLESGKIV